MAEWILHVGRPFLLEIIQIMYVYCQGRVKECSNMFGHTLGAPNVCHKLRGQGCLLVKK